ncbi:MAG: hypothetical protein KDA41_08255 [Planctomycetales bacterium]|nr:hypothetical protein [Planctomycetales bacterium]
MTPLSDADLLKSEKEKRRRCADPLMQWKVFQATCAWLDSQQPVPRNSKASCLMRQRRINAQLAEIAADVTRR